MLLPLFVLGFKQSDASLQPLRSNHLIASY